MALACPFEISGVQVTQNYHMVGLGMNGLVALSGLRRGWPWCLPKFLFYNQFLACSQKPFQALFFDYNSFNPTNNIHNTYQFSNFPNGNHNSPNLIISAPPNIVGSHYMTMKPRCIRNEWAAYWNHCINGSTKLGCTTHIIRHLWHVLKVQYIDI